MFWLPKNKLIEFSKLFENLSKSILRQCSSVCINSSTDKNEEKTSVREHIYKRRMSRYDVINYLYDNIVFSQDDIIVTNKPYGIGKQKQQNVSNKRQSVSFNDFYLNDLLPDLAEKMNCTEMKVAFSPHRFSSGLLILTSSNIAEDKIKKAIKLSIRRRDFDKTFLTVCTGTPVKKSLNAKFAVKGITENNTYIPVLMEKWLKNEQKKNLVEVFSWKHKVLSCSKLASLVEVNISKMNYLGLTMASKNLSPILGDGLFASRVSSIFGVQLKNQLYHAPVAEMLSQELLSALRLSEYQETLVPYCAHLKSLRLAITKKKVLTLSVPPPETFIWTCQQLNLLPEGSHTLLIS